MRIERASNTDKLTPAPSLNRLTLDSDIGPFGFAQTPLFLGSTAAYSFPAANYSGLGAEFIGTQH